MMGAIELCIVAACLVLFVPTCMSVLRMSLNKMFFFSCAFFIILSLGVHFNLSPNFLPSISDFASSDSSALNIFSRDSCLASLHDVVWHLQTVILANGSLQYRESWDWEESISVSGCGFKKLSRADVSKILNGSWIVVAGDSQARFAALSILNLVLDSESMESATSDLFKRHSSYQTVVDENGMTLDFVWAPYVSNLTNLLTGLNKIVNYPDILIMNSGLWHMLHMSNASDYGNSLQSLKSSILSYSPNFRREEYATVSLRAQYMFWLGLPNLVHSMLNTEEKRLKMSDGTSIAYDRELHQSNLLHQYGGPLILLDIDSLSQDCGSKCTDDGMHYTGVVYDAAIQIMLNALVIESHQAM